MHCTSCDKELTDVESCRKDLRGKYLDMCSFCLVDIRKDVAFSSHQDLNIVIADDEDE